MLILLCAHDKLSLGESRNPSWLHPRCPRLAARWDCTAGVHFRILAWPSRSSREVRGTWQSFPRVPALHVHESKTTFKNPSFRCWTPKALAMQSGKRLKMNISRDFKLVSCENSESFKIICLGQQLTYNVMNHSRESNMRALSRYQSSCRELHFKYTCVSTSDGLRRSTSSRRCVSGHLMNNSEKWISKHYLETCIYWYMIRKFERFVA